MRFKNWLLLQKKHVLQLALLSVLAVVFSHTVASEHNQDKQLLSLKAAFVYYFLLYTETPTPRPHYTICLLGSQTIAPELALIARKEIGGKPIGFIQYSPPLETDNLKTCSLLYFSGQNKREFIRLRQAFEAHKVLTIMDGDANEVDGALVYLHMFQHKLSFELNLTQAQAIGLNFSPKLLRLARKTR